VGGSIESCVEQPRGRVIDERMVASPRRPYTLQSDGDGHEMNGRVGQRDLDVVGHGYRGRVVKASRRRFAHLLGCCLACGGVKHHSGRGAQAPSFPRLACLHLCVWGVDRKSRLGVSAWVVGIVGQFGVGHR
jgi:hypothetical protein